MALRDKIVVYLDNSIPPKERVIEVKASAPGGTVQQEATPPGVVGLIEITEKTRKGNVKKWVRVNPEHVVKIEFVAGK